MDLIKVNIRGADEHEIEWAAMQLAASRLIKADENVIEPDGSVTVTVGLLAYREPETLRGYVHEGHTRFAIDPKA